MISITHLERLVSDLEVRNSCLRRALDARNFDLKVLKKELRRANNKFELTNLELERANNTIKHLNTLLAENFKESKK